MRELSRVDLGSIQIHKKVLAQLAAAAIEKMEGVHLLEQSFTGGLLDLCGIRTFPGISVTVDKNNQVSLEIKVRVKYGLNIQDIARQAQDAVRASVERTVDIDLKDVNINIQGMERGTI